MATTQLRIQGLAKTFGGTRALRGVDLEVAAGEVHALVGHNGSGKSTLIKVLAGFHEPNPGSRAEVGGQPFALGRRGAAEQAGIRFVHQDLALVGGLDAVDNLALGAGYRRRAAGAIDWREQERSTRAILADLGYDFDVRRPVASLTPAERTGVAVARCLRGSAGSARLLVLDEPTASLPRNEAERLLELVRAIKELGVAVLFVSHHLAEVFAVADRVTVLRNGEVAGCRSIEAVTRPELVALMVGSEGEETSAPERPVVQDELALELSGVGGKHLSELDLGVHRGEIVGIAGLTGSGRDEVARLCFGAIPRTGDVRVDGALLPPMRPDLAVNMGLGLIPADRQADALLMNMNVGENLTMGNLRSFTTTGGLIRGKKEAATVEQWLSRLSVRTRSAKAPVATLSGGNQQKLVLGRLLQSEPRALLLDEPTQGVDVAAKVEIHQLIDGIARRGSAVLLSSADEQELERLCHRVLVLHEGRPVADLRADAVSAREINRLVLDPPIDQIGSTP